MVGLWTDYHVKVSRKMGVLDAATCLKPLTVIQAIDDAQGSSYSR